jgi:hypothetical protein
MVFSQTPLDVDSIGEVLLNATHFEVLWIMCKQSSYGAIECWGAKQIEIFDSRWKEQRANVY